MYCKNLIEQSGLKEHPVRMMLVPVTTKRGDSLGALVDFKSDTNYITHWAADGHGRTGEKISLVVYGIIKIKVKVNTKTYLVTIKVQTSRGTLRFHELIYGMKDTDKVGHVMTSEQLEQFFPEAKPGEWVGKAWETPFGKWLKKASPQNDRETGCCETHQGHARQLEQHCVVGELRNRTKPPFSDSACVLSLE